MKINNKKELLSIQEALFLSVYTMYAIFPSQLLSLALLKNIYLKPTFDCIGNTSPNI